MAFLVENRVGRFIEARMVDSFGVEEAQQVRTKLFLMLSKIPGRAVMFGDLRQCEAFSPEVSERFVTMFKTDNPKVERTAFLVVEGAFARQVERLVSEAARATADGGRAAPPRRVFRDTDLKAARDWLCEVLDDKERARVVELFRSL